MGAPRLEQFRIEPGREGIVHLVFDAPGRTMNVFSNAAIHELGQFAAWLPTSDARGVVVRSGKDTAFCAGADLGELGVAYEMIMAAPPADRFRIAFDHFFPLSRAIRALERAGKPVAAAVNGLALGGGCELAMGAHYRVVTDAPDAAFGVPESLVGLLPGGGGTQRLPRLVGAAAALPLLLDGERLAGEAAVAAGIADRLVRAGEEVDAAENWILGGGEAVQPWDRPGFEAEDPGAPVAARRAAVLAQTQGHYPAPLAILDCVERGLPQAMDGALRTEMEIFSGLIQRPEPRNMIQTLFLGKLDHDRAARKGEMPPFVEDVIAAVRGAVRATLAETSVQGLAVAGFTAGAAPFDGAHPLAPAVPNRESNPEQTGLWFERADLEIEQRAGADLLVAAAAAAAPWTAIEADTTRLADYACVKALGFPAYAGGPIALARYLGFRAAG